MTAALKKPRDIKKFRNDIKRYAQCAAYYWQLWERQDHGLSQKLIKKGAEFWESELAARLTAISSPAEAKINAKALIELYRICGDLPAPVVKKSPGFRHD